MRSAPVSLVALAAVGLAVMLIDRPAAAQTPAAKTPPPTAADWAALAMIPGYALVRDKKSA